MSQSGEFLFPWIFIFLMVLETFGTKKSLHNRSQQNLVESVSEQFSSEKTLRIDPEENLVPEKSWKQFQREFGTKKGAGTSLGKNLVPQKSQKWSWSDFWVSSVLQCLASTLCFLCLNFFLTSDFFSNNIWWEVENRQVEPGEGWRGRGGRVLIFEQEVFFNFWCQCLVGCFSPVWEHPPTYDRE